MESGWRAAGCSARLISCRACVSEYGVPKLPMSCVSVMGVWSMVEAETGCGGVIGETCEEGAICDGGISGIGVVDDVAKGEGV